MSRPCEAHGVGGDCGTCRLVETASIARALVALEDLETFSLDRLPSLEAGG